MQKSLDKWRPQRPKPDLFGLLKALAMMWLKTQTRLILSKINPVTPILLVLFGVSAAFIKGTLVPSKPLFAGVKEMPVLPVRTNPLTLDTTKGVSIFKEKYTTNEAAPVPVGYLTEQMVYDYVAKFSKTAVADMHKYGVPASISLAQGLVESRAGDSKLARNNNNHFGIKCFSRRCGKSHCSNFTDDTHKDFFRKFNSPWESWRAHSIMISTGRYAKLKKYGTDYRKWAYGLKSVGYATDRTYAEKLIGVIQRYNLAEYDRK